MLDHFSIQLTNHHICMRTWWIFCRKSPEKNSITAILSYELDTVWTGRRYRNCHSDDSNVIISKQETSLSLQIPRMTTKTTAKKIYQKVSSNRFPCSHSDWLYETNTNIHTKSISEKNQWFCPLRDIFHIQCEYSIFLGMKFKRDSICILSIDTFHLLKNLVNCLNVIP